MTPFQTPLPFGLPRPFQALPHPREVVRQFTPNWFAVTMGTGILSLALGQVPVSTPLLRQLGECLWLFNAALFVLFSLVYASRWWLYGNEARRIFAHPTVSMFLGTIPMGLATLVNGCLQYGVPRWGAEMVSLAYGLWWVDVVMALACGVLVPYMMFTRQQHSIEQMTAVWLLPVVAAEVAAASGALLVPHLDNPAVQLQAVITSYVLWAYSVPVALSVLVILLLRLALHKLPHQSMAASSWLALGPVGTAALGMLLLGSHAPSVFAAQGLPAVATVAAGLGLIAGVLFWGLGAWWMILAMLITARYLREGIAFNLGWWGYTFPLGVYALTTLKLGYELHSAFFQDLGTGLVAMLVVMWAVVGCRTLKGAWRGELFVSPCIALRCGRGE
ncbi:TDT family transporter [uncultured Pseudomonas sp.]|uniref:TDT family transporter n=1 Tax=uncultured Pseudomonas sp. TaxID=114707 RepID=UPI0025F5AE8C|nr:TDT family transporter [uncultured Pseudomonas sp.]